MILMEKLIELSKNELDNINGGGWYDIGVAIGNWIGSWSSANGHCDHFNDSEIIGSASNNYIS